MTEYRNGSSNDRMHPYTRREHRPKSSRQITAIEKAEEYFHNSRHQQQFDYELEMRSDRRDYAPDDRNQYRDLPPLPYQGGGGGRYRNNDRGHGYDVDRRRGGYEAKYPSYEVNGSSRYSGSYGNSSVQPYHQQQQPHQYQQQHNHHHRHHDQHQKQRGGQRSGGPKRRVLTEEEYSTSKNVFVGNLPYSFRDRDVEKMAIDFGEVTAADLTRIHVPMDAVTGNSKGFAFVEFEKRADAVKFHEAVQSFEFNNLKVRVDWDLNWEDKQKMQKNNTQKQ